MCLRLRIIVTSDQDVQFMNFPPQIFFNDNNLGYRAAILKKNSLWLLPFYMTWLHISIMKRCAERLYQTSLMRVSGFVINCLCNWYILTISSYLKPKCVSGFVINGLCNWYILFPHLKSKHVSGLLLTLLLTYLTRVSDRRSKKAWSPRSFLHFCQA